MKSLLHYLQWQRRYPTRKDFIDTGLGIQARHKRCEPYWKGHLDRSKRFIRKHCVARDDSDKLAILGAGRLLDVDRNWPLESFSSLDLYDADPGCIPLWRRVARSWNSSKDSVGMYIEDLSATLDVWTEQVMTLLGQQADADQIKLIDLLLGFHCPHPKLQRSYDTLVSLNLLSQIPLYWRDRVHALLLKHWQLDTDEHGRYEDSLEQALQQTMRLLQEQHLGLLQEYCSKTLVIIADTSFFYYQSDQADWQEEQSLFVDPTDLGKFSIVASKKWYWDIAPQGVEQDDYGIVHQVLALAAERAG